MYITISSLILAGDTSEIKDGERLPLAVKDMGSCEVYPQTISHNPNGRFVVVSTYNYIFMYFEGNNSWKCTTNNEF